MAINFGDLDRRAAKIRLGLLEAFSYGKAHHFGGSLSCVDLVTALYFYKMNYSKENFRAKDRDRLILSKGHSVPVQYVALVELGIHDKESLKKIKQLGSVFQGHPDMRKTLGIEAPTGSLGQGLSFANGVGLALKHDEVNSKIFVILGDGEMQEGQVWEAAMTTSHYGLTNVCVIVDRNKFQSQGSIDDLMGMEPLEKKFESFGWNSRRIDGHNFHDICEALDSLDECQDQPLAIIADTIKGKGIGFMEGTHKFHNYSLSVEEYNKAKEELQSKIDRIDPGV